MNPKMLVRMGAFVAVISAAGFQAAVSQQRGVLLHPIGNDRANLIGEPGQEVLFWPTGTGGFSYQVQVGDTVVASNCCTRFVPYDDNFTPARILVSIAASRSSGQDFDFRRRVILARRAVELFPFSPFREVLEATACRELYSAEGWETDGKTTYTTTRSCIEEFFEIYPASQYRDELEWILLRIDNIPYEYEGAVEEMIADAVVFADYVADNPHSRVRQEIEMRIGRLYHSALDVSAPDAGVSFMEVIEDSSMGDGLRARAASHYEWVLVNGDVEWRARASVALYNLRNGRRIYANPNSW